MKTSKLNDLFNSLLNNELTVSSVYTKEGIDNLLEAFIKDIVANNIFVFWEDIQNVDTRKLVDCFKEIVNEKEEEIEQLEDYIEELEHTVNLSDNFIELLVKELKEKDLKIERLEQFKTTSDLN